MPRVAGAVLSAQLASMTELTTTLGTQDLYDLLEVVMVDAQNRKTLEDRARER